MVSGAISVLEGFAAGFSSTRTDAASRTAGRSGSLLGANVSRPSTARAGKRTGAGIDARCKILLWARLAGLVNKGDPDAIRIYRKLRAAMPDKAAATFADWPSDPLPDWHAEPVPDLDSEGSPGGT